MGTKLQLLCVKSMCSLNMILQEVGAGKSLCTLLTRVCDAFMSVHVMLVIGFIGKPSLARDTPIVKLPSMLYHVSF